MNVLERQHAGKALADAGHPEDRHGSVWDVGRRQAGPDASFGMVAAREQVSYLRERARRLGKRSAPDVRTKR